MGKIGYHADFNDLVKAVQIQLCISTNLHHIVTVSKLLKIHLTLPILNVHFLHALLRGYNLFSEQFSRKYYVSPFSIDISQINLSKQSNP